MRRVGLLISIAVLAAGLAACAPSLPPGTRVCVGFPAEICERRLAALEREGALHGGIVGYRIVCTAGGCTSSLGDGTETVVFADGTSREHEFGYAVPIGTPPTGQVLLPLPVEPICLGVPAEWCREMGRMGADSVADWSSIVAIQVLCTGSCTSSKGEGVTRVRLSDGSEKVEADWAYDGEMPPDSP